MDHLNYIGYAAGILTSVGFVPQIIQGLKTKKMKDVALGQYVILFTGMSLWLAYGVVRNDLALIAANIVSITCCIIIMALKIAYGKE